MHVNNVRASLKYWSVGKKSNRTTSYKTVSLKAAQVFAAIPYMGEANTLASNAVVNMRTFHDLMQLLENNK